MSTQVTNEELAGKAKEIIITLIESGETLKVNLSDYLSSKLGYHYTYIGNSFAAHEKISIRDFVIKKKIERAKELLQEDNTVSEVAAVLNYSSVAHFSNQFKKETKMNPSSYLRSLKHSAVTAA